MKEHSFDRIFGKEPDRQEAEKDMLKRFEVQPEFKTERKKTPEELEIIKMTNEATDLLIKQFGGEPFNIPDKNVHVIEGSEFDYLAVHYLHDPELINATALFSENLQSILMRDQGDDFVKFSGLLIHEMYHFKSYQSLLVKNKNSKLVARVRRVGFEIGLRGQEKPAFVDLNEALTEHLAVATLGDLISKSKLPAFLKERIEQIPEEEREKKVFGASYALERVRLIEIAEQIYDKNKDKFKNENEIFKLFFDAVFSGKLLKVAKLIENTFGEGSFRIMGEKGMPESKFEKELGNSFEEQFSRKEEIEILGGKIDAVDIRPEILKTAVPTLFAPGWGGTPETYKDTIEALCEKNRRVLSLAHARKGGDEKLAPDEIQKEYPADELRKALALLKILEEKNIDKVDAVAHSEGGINAAIAASLAPEKFRNIIFVNAGGLIGPDKFPKLAGRFVFGVIQEALKTIFNKDKLGKVRLQRAFKENLNYIAKNPLRALKESIVISNTETYGMLKNLHDKGIRIAVVGGVDDPVFPVDKMQEILKEGWLDGFVSVKGGHGEIILHPEKYVGVVDELLDNLEKKHWVK